MAIALARPRKTLEDLWGLPDGVRGELIDGEVYVTPAPFEGHQEAVGALFAALFAHVRRSETGRVLLAPFDVHLPTGDVVQPDVLWVSPARAGIVHQGAHGAPDLVVEVLSAPHPERDRIVKRDLYARSGVGEYWIADPEARGIEVLVLDGAAYRPAGWFTAGTRLVSPSLPGFSVAVDEVFAAPPSRSVG